MNHLINNSTSTQVVSRIALASWVTLVIVLVALSLNTLKSGYQFDTNIMALLPEDHQSETLKQVHQVITKGRDRDLIILIGTNNIDSASKALTLNAVKNVHGALLDSQLFAQINGLQTPSSNLANRGIVNAHNFNFLSNTSVQALKSQDSRLTQDALEKMFSPAGGFGNNNLLTDPLGLFQQWQLSLLKNQPLAIEDDWLTLNRGNAHFRFIGLKLKDSAFNPGYQQQIKSLITRLEAALDDDLELLSSGLIVHATHGAEQAKREISTIGLGSLLAITTILLVVFRSLAPIAYILLPLAIGALFSFSICLLIFERIHLITLAFGTSLIGIAIDYSLHYVCADRESEGSATLRRIFSGLLLALISSVMAYIAQAAAPFPGLRQMAVFAALGLIGAWITVVLVLPKVTKPSHRKYTNRQSRDTILALDIAKFAKRWGNIAESNTKYLIAAFALSITALASHTIVNDDLSSLQTSPQELIDNDIRMSRLLSAESIGSYFLVQGNSEQAVLEQEEKLRNQLHPFELNKSLQGHIASSQFIPSIKRQTYNHQLLDNKVYSDGGLLSVMLAPTGMTQLEQAMRNEFFRYSFNPVTFKRWRSSSASQSIDNHWLGEIDGRYYSVITLVGNVSTEAKQKLSSIADDDKVLFIDRPKSISTILENYRENLFSLLLLAYALVTGLLLLRYRAGAFRIIAPPLLASLTVLAYLVVTASSLTVFHCLALLLVLGIGLDAAIFLKETQASAYTWLAVSLSSLTTFLAFGLLSFSQTPVLHFFGQTVAIGIIAIWITTPFFCIPKDNNNAQLKP